MYKVALLGRDIKYTQSPRIHGAVASALGVELEFDVADVTFDRFEREVERLLDTCDGFYVTKPYKTEAARLFGADGAVNLVRSRDRAAFNTDGTGFVSALDRNFDGWRKSVNGALVLGAGGAAFATSKALSSLGKKVYVLNRTLRHALTLCAQTGAELYVNQPAELVVNCTSLGWNGEDVLRALCVLPSFAYAFDTVYVKEGTPFLRRCGACGARVCDGTDMLVYQAIAGDKLLFGSDADAEEVYEKTMNFLSGGTDGEDIGA